MSLALCVHRGSIPGAPAARGFSIKMVIYGWIMSGGIGEVDGLFVVQGRYLIHWPTFRTRQFKPRTKLRGILPTYSEESQHGMAGKG